MLKNKWKIELWFQSFSYFIHKIDSDFILEEYLDDYLPKRIPTKFYMWKSPT